MLPHEAFHPPPSFASLSNVVMEFNASVESQQYISSPCLFSRRWSSFDFIAATYFVCKFSRVEKLLTFSIIRSLVGLWIKIHKMDWQEKTSLIIFVYTGITHKEIWEVARWLWFIHIASQSWSKTSGLRFLSGRIGSEGREGVPTGCFARQIN